MVTDENVPLASIKRHRQFWIHYLDFFFFIHNNNLFLLLSLYILISCEAWPSPLTRFKEKQKRFLKSAHKVSSSSTVILIQGLETGVKCFMTAGTEWNSSLLKVQSWQSWSCLHARTDILGGEKDEKEKRKMTKRQGMFLKSSVFVFLVRTNKRSVGYGDKTNLNCPKEETLPLSCWCLLVARSWGGVHPPCCPLLFLLAFQGWLASGFWQRRQLGQTVGGRRGKLGSPSYRLLRGQQEGVDVFKSLELWLVYSLYDVPEESHTRTCISAAVSTQTQQTWVNIALSILVPFVQVCQINCH